MSLIKKSKSQQSHLTSDRRQKERDLDFLLEQLNHDDPTQRRWAARDLQTYGDLAIEPLCKRLEKEKDNAVQDAILDALLTLDQELVINFLLPFLSSEDAGLRNKVIDILQQMPIIEKYISSLLNNKNPDIRIFAINILQALPNYNIGEILLKIALKDDNINVVATALDALVEIATPDMKDKLEKIKLKFKDREYICFVVDTILDLLQE